MNDYWNYLAHGELEKERKGAQILCPVLLLDVTNWDLPSIVISTMRENMART